MRKRTKRILREVTIWMSVLLISLPLSLLLFQQSAYAAFPAVQTTNTTNGTGASSAPTVNLPTGITSNDLLIVLFRTAIGSSGVGWPGDWTELIESTTDASDDAIAIGYRYADGTEGSTISLSTASAKYAAVSYRIGGAKDPAEQAPQISTQATGTSTTPDPTSLSPAGGARDYLWLWLGGWEGEQTSPPASNPTSYSSPLGANSGTGGAITTNVRVASARRNLNATSEDPGSWTISVSDDWTAWTLAVHPKQLYTQRAFRFFEDGAESSSTAIDTENTNISRAVDSDSNLQLRISVQETNGGSGASTDDWQLQYSKNSGTYTDVTTSSSDVKGYNSASLTDGGATSDRSDLSNGTGTFDVGEVSEDGLIDDDALVRSNFSEQLYSLTIVAADTVNGDTLDFRLLYNGATTAFTYTVTPRITVSENGPATDQCMRHCNWFSGGSEQGFFWAD